MSRGWKIVAVIGVVWIVLALAYNHHKNTSRCIITTASAQKLCGDDARAWCDATDADRAVASDTGDALNDLNVQRAQDACDLIREP